MKKQYRLLIPMILLLAVIAWWWHSRSLKSQTNVIMLLNVPQFSSATQSNVASTTNRNQSLVDNILVKIQREILSRKAQAGVNQDWRTPIAFYGKVVDESNLPLQDVHVDFNCNDLSKQGTSLYKTSTDNNGFFSISGIYGKLLSVDLNKEGYYTSRRDNANFYYAGQSQNFVPNVSNPVIFHLRKKGVSNPLIFFEKDFLISKDGTPVDVDLVKGQRVPAGQGQLRVECWTNDAGKKHGQKYDWKCRITVPSGGLQQYDEEFPFLAPADGYQAKDEIDMPAKMEKGWARNAKRNYFLKLNNGDYARINLEMIAGGGHFFHIVSVLNPSGSPNLEPQSQ